jgi:hypothetical protein
LLPITKKAELATQEVAGETLVYDLKRHRAHCLNAAASAVWRYCDGQTTISGMAEKLHSETGLPADETVVQLALKQLRAAGLIECDRPVAPAEKLPTRREIAKRLAIPAALALPLVSSIVAPTPGMAASCVGSGAGSGDPPPRDSGRGHHRGRGRLSRGRSQGGFKRVN